MFLPMSCTSPFTVAMSTTAVRAGVRIRGAFLLHVGSQPRHRALHHSRALHHLRQEHFARAKQVADDLHAVHQRSFDDQERPAVI